MQTKKQKILVLLSVVFLVLLFGIPFGLSAMIYEDNFGERYEPYAPTVRSTDEFDGLNSQRYLFTLDQGQSLVGYKYYKNLENHRGVVVIAHGLGGGGQNAYMDVADFFASNGYVVFAYDATGNGESEGSSVKGLPQGLIDLDHAIQFVKQTSGFEGLPILLFGHSWGAYSAGSVLNLHPDVKAVVMVAGFSRSIDIIEEEGKKIAGDGMSALLPFMSFYERMKFGKYASYTSLDGFEKSQAGVMVIHSADDEMISPEKAFDVFYDRYQNDPRFSFVKFENRGHDYVLNSDASREYREEFNREFETYVNSLNEELTSEIKAAYLKDHLDKKRLFDLDQELMTRIVDFYDHNLTK